jgi:hypothetical protein
MKLFPILVAASILTAGTGEWSNHEWRNAQKLKAFKDRRVQIPGANPGYYDNCGVH